MALHYRIAAFVAVVAWVLVDTDSWMGLTAAPQPPASAGYVFTHLAGIPWTGATVDGTGPGAQFYSPGPIARDATGHLYVIDAPEHVIRRVTPDGVVTTWAGTPGVAGEVNGPRQAALFQQLRSIAVDAVGIVYIADNNVIRRVDLAGQVTTLAGVERMRGLTDGQGRAARFAFPTSLSVAPDGTLYLAEPAQNTVRRVSAGGDVTTVAGTGSAVNLSTIRGVAVAPDGNVFVLAGTTLVRMTPGGGILGQVAVTIDDLAQMVVDPSGRVLLAAQTQAHIVRVDGTSVTTLTPGVQTLGGIAAATDGTHVVTSLARRIVYRVQGDGTGAMAIAGAYRSGDPAVDGAAGTATFGNLGGVTSDSGGVVWVSERATGGTAASGHTIRRVDANGTVTTVAGVYGASGLADGLGAGARFNNPRGVAVGPSGHLVIADTDNHAVRGMTPAGVVTTLAGGTRGFADGVGAAARFNGPRGVAVDAAGRVFVTDANNRRVRRIDVDGTVSTIAGTGSHGATDGPGATATLSDAIDGIVVTSTGTVYVADGANHTIRAITAAGDVSTLAGGAGQSGYVDGAGTAARFHTPTGLGLEADGSLLVFDSQNCRIRRVTSAGIVTTLSGRSCSSTVGQNGHSSTATFWSHAALSIGADGRIVIGEMGGGVVRLGTPDAGALPMIATPPSSVTALVGQMAQLSVTTSTGVTLQWEVSTDGGATFGTVTDGATYSGSQTTTLTIAAPTVGLTGSVYRVVATNTVGSTASRPAVLTVLGVTTRPGALRFTALIDAATGAMVTVTPAQSLTVLPGSGVTWTAASDQPWLQLSSHSGTGAAAVSLSVSNVGLSPSVIDRTATMTVTPSSGVAVSVPVTLQVFATGSTVAPWGWVDTPSNGGTVNGTIAVTGWAHDDVGIAHIGVYRDCLAAEPEVNCQMVLGQSVVYIGDGVRVPGARGEDGRSYPQERLGGWGYLLLTNMLPRVTPFQPYGGEGMHRLVVVATDIEGHRTIIGAPTITLTNDTITRPFGAIDTPGQGETVTGTIPIFGWAITPDDGSGIEIPTTGATMVVFVDGLPIGQVTYNQCRVGTNPTPPGEFCADDVASIFGNLTPQPTGTPRISNPSVFRNLDAGRGAIGSFVLDTTGMTNGLHSLAWSVTDSASRVEGIGSRNFEVLNGAADARPGVASAERWGVSTAPVWVREGFGDTGWRVLVSGADGVRRAAVSVPGRIELAVEDDIDAASLMIGGVSHALPAGASLAGSRLMWAPGPGYLGDYRLVLQHGGVHTEVIVTVR